MIDIFISYARNDQHYIEWLKKVLQRLKIEENISYFQDVEHILPGEDFKDRIDSAIVNATVIICFLSPNYFSSEFIQKHELPLIEGRFNRNVKILPVLAEEVYLNPDSIFKQLQQITYAGKSLSEVKAGSSATAFFPYFESILRQEFKFFPRNGANQTNVRYNLVVVGKAGVGKSALINYLFGEEVVRSGIGKPITPLGFQQNDLEILGVPASIFDSAGLEVGSYRIWMEKLEDELSMRGPTQSVHKWFHTVLYCVQAPGLRIEPYELEIIDRFIQDRYKVIIVLTKSYISEKKLNELANSIKDNIASPIRCVYVNSQDEELAGSVVKMYGKQKLLKEVQLSLVESLTDRIPARCIGFMAKYIDERCDEQIRYINDNISSIPRNALADNVKLALDRISRDIYDQGGHFRKIIARETKYTLSVYSALSRLLEHTFDFEEMDMPGMAAKQVTIPKIRSFGSRLEELTDDSYDWDYTEKYGGFVDGASKVIAFPFILFGSLLVGVIEHFDDVNNWRKNTAAEIEKFKEEAKKKLWSEEDDIRKFFSDRFRKFEA